MKVLPFSVGDLYGGLGECHGLLRDEGGDLCLEYQVKDTLIGALRTGVRQVRIPGKQIADIRLKKGWFSTKLVIQMATMEGLASVPGLDRGRLTLSIARKDRPAAEQFLDGLYA
jgi:hypothetical protein